eukprot:gnl/MRDRNA2_/MRDRNA2_27658_c0_seq1.p1 gnl/MRDRNA2_/MRDRNA2_27658_c0~~gnl/MRDRNA2_/MRDRNA2_27658_c0_seq1.p1  ORF type:complete len:1580 (+),score=300.65 gnl/MRDRNA2_/MRDRNA2_27658_c0_seq1:113-4741(+)
MLGLPGQNQMRVTSQVPSARMFAQDDDPGPSISARPVPSPQPYSYAGKPAGIASLPQDQSRAAYGNRSSQSDSGSEPLTDRDVADLVRENNLLRASLKEAERTSMIAAQEVEKVRWELRLREQAATELERAASQLRTFNEENVELKKQVARMRETGEMRDSCLAYTKNEVDRLQDSIEQLKVATELEREAAGRRAAKDAVDEYKRRLSQEKQTSLDKSNKIEELKAKVSKLSAGRRSRNAKKEGAAEMDSSSEFDLQQDKINEKRLRAGYNVCLDRVGDSIVSGLVNVEALNMTEPWQTGSPERRYVWIGRSVGEAPIWQAFEEPDSPEPVIALSLERAGVSVCTRTMSILVRPRVSSNGVQCAYDMTCYTHLDFKKWVRAFKVLGILGEQPKDASLNSGMFTTIAGAAPVQEEVMDGLKKQLFHGSSQNQSTQTMETGTFSPRKGSKTKPESPRTESPSPKPSRGRGQAVSPMRFKKFDPTLGDSLSTISTNFTALPSPETFHLGDTTKSSFFWEKDHETHPDGGMKMQEPQRKTVTVSPAFQVAETRKHTRAGMAAVRSMVRMGLLSHMPFRHWEPLKVSCWSVRSPTHSGNLFETYPGWAVLSGSQQEDFFNHLMSVATELLFSENSPVLGELLGDAPLTELKQCQASHSKESLPLNVCHSEQLLNFFMVRHESLTEMEQRAFVDKWCKSPLVRWGWWKEQQVRAFLADDGSGGKSTENTILEKVVAPVLDESVPSFGLGCADDMPCSDRRRKRTEWLRSDTSHNSKTTALSHGEENIADHDYFKLMVWDLLLVAVRDEARKRWKDGGTAWDNALADVKKSFSENQSQYVSCVINSIALLHSDVVVLNEVSQELLYAENFLQRIKDAGGYWYHMYELADPEGTDNTVILARYERFPTATVEPFPLDSHRKLGLKLHSAVDDQDVQVIGAHLCSDVADVSEFFDELEKRLEKHPKTILAANLSFDVRKPPKHLAPLMNQLTSSEVHKDWRHVQRFLKSNSEVWSIDEDLGTTNTKWTPLQAHVSRTDLHEHSMQDYVFLSNDFMPDEGHITGYISSVHFLPDGMCPALHAPLTWEADHEPMSDSVVHENHPLPELVVQDSEHMRDIKSHDPGVFAHEIMHEVAVDDAFKTNVCHLLLIPHERHPAVGQILMDYRNQIACQQDFLRYREVDQDKARKILFLLADGSDHLNFQQFCLLHKAVTAILSRVMFSRLALKKKMWDAQTDFWTVDRCNTGRIQVSEMMLWFKELATSSEHPQWRSQGLAKVLQDIERYLVAQKRLEKHAKAWELMCVMARYDKAYIEFKRRGLSAEIPNEGTSAPKQPESIATLEELLEQGRQIFDKARSFAEEVTAAVEADFWSMGPLKTHRRCQEKAQTEYDGDIRRICDIVRFSVVCKDLDTKRRGIEYVRKHDQWQILCVTSGLAHDAKICVANAGYRDVKINAVHKETGHVVEIQVHILNFYVLKQEFYDKNQLWARQLSAEGIVFADDILDSASVIARRDGCDSSRRIGNGQPCTMRDGCFSETPRAVWMLEASKRRATP